MKTYKISENNDLWSATQRMWEQVNNVFEAADRVMKHTDVDAEDVSTGTVIRMRLCGSRWHLFWRLSKAALSALLYGKATVNVVRK